LETATFAQRCTTSEAQQLQPDPAAAMAAPAEKTRPRPPLDKRQDFPKILGVAGLFCTIAGWLNGVAVYELGTPVGYTSGPCVNLGRFLATGDAVAPNIAGIVGMFSAGGFVAGLTGSACDGDAIFEGRMSPGMLFSAFLLVVGAYIKKHFNRPYLVCQLWAFSQGLMNGVSSRFSAAPIRATHTAGGQTDAALSLAQAVIAVSKGQTPPPLRKLMLNAVCCFGMIFGGFAAGRTHKRWGALTALIPAAALAFSGSVLPALIAPKEEEQEDASK